MFTVGAPDPITGEIELIPDTPISLGPANVGGAAATCILDFEVNVLTLPTKDSDNVVAGTQTVPIARAGVRGETSGLLGSAFTTVEVTVKGAVTQITDLIDVTQTFNLPRGIENSLVVKLQAALAGLDADRSGACGSLGAFINHARAQSGKSLTVVQSDELSAAASQIRQVVGCP